MRIFTKVRKEYHNPKREKGGLVLPLRKNWAFDPKKLPDLITVGVNHGIGRILTGGTGETGKFVTWEVYN